MEEDPKLPTVEMPFVPSNYTPLREMDKVNVGEISRSYLRPNAMSLRKPLAPNTLDVAAVERGKELAAQRRKAGFKWVTVMPR
jgi:hypothetical protein